MRESQKLLSYGFRNFDTQTLYQEGINLQQLDVYFGQSEKVEVGVAEDITVTFPRGYYDDIKVEMDVPEYLEAPISNGAQVGEMTLTLDDELLYSAPLQTLQGVSESNFSVVWVTPSISFMRRFSAMTDKPKIEFPCRYPIKIIAAAEEDVAVESLPSSAITHQN